MSNSYTYLVILQLLLDMQMTRKSMQQSKFTNIIEPITFNYYYVKQCSLSYAYILELSRELVSHILFIVCTVIHICLSSGSLVFTTLRWYVIRDNMTSMITITDPY